MGCFSSEGIVPTNKPETRNQKPEGKPETRNQKPEKSPPPFWFLVCLLVFLWHSDDQQHQRWNQCDGQHGGEGHGKVLREGQRLEELSFLRFERKDGHE